MDCFIKKIFLNKIDEQVHAQFVRFGKGDYKGRAVISLWKTGKVKLKGSFEYANEFVNFISEFPVKFSGVILSKEKLNLEGEKAKAGIYYYEVSNLSNEKIKEIFNKVYFMLLDASSSEIELKIKKKLPKPGKSEKAKIDDNFCQLEADLSYYEKIKEAFFWDVQDCKKVKASHEYIINELVIPKPQELKIPDGCQNSEGILKGEKNFELIRIKTKRKGKIIRKLEVDNRQEIKEKEFEA